MAGLLMVGGVLYLVTGLLFSLYVSSSYSSAAAEYDKLGFAKEQAERISWCLEPFDRYLKLWDKQVWAGVAITLVAGLVIKFADVGMKIYTISITPTSVLVSLCLNVLVLIVTGLVYFDRKRQSLAPEIKSRSAQLRSEGVDLIPAIRAGGLLFRHMTKLMDPGA